MADRRGTAERGGAKGWKHPVSLCPGCGATINASSDPHNRGRPRTGDLTLALCCGTLLRFDKMLALHAPTMEELQQLPQSTLEELKEQQERWRVRQSGARILSLPPRV